MAIGSVKELIDYESETIKIAKKHGGGSNVEVLLKQLCTAGDIRTDANGYVTNTLDYPSGTYTPIDYRYITTVPVMGVTCMVQVENGCISGVNKTRLRLVDASGSPLANITEGIADMGVISMRYLNI